jgi:polyferredoxin
MWYKIKSRKFGILKIFHRLKWAVLIVLAIVLPFFTGVHWFSKLCPYGGLIGGIPWALWNPNSPVTEEPVIEAAGFGFWFWLKMIILAGFIVWFVLAKRPFCRTVCPLGAIFSLFNRISWFKIEVSAKCPDCDSCNSLCPMDLKVREEADFENCIKCLDCTACKHVKSKFSLRYGFTKAVKAHKLKPVVQTTSFARDR